MAAPATMAVKIQHLNRHNKILGRNGEEIDQGNTPHLGNLPRRCCPRLFLGMANLDLTPSRKVITAQTMDEAKIAAYANDPQTELVILGVSENPAVTTCGWAKQFFGSKPCGV